MRRAWLRRTGLVITVVISSGGCGSSRGSDPSAGATTTSTAPASASSTFGTMASPCGKGSGGTASDTGVTASEIHIGFGDDAGYAASPGLNHELSDAMRAMIAWCNKQGGINGRTVKGTYYDAKGTDIINALTQACSDGAFMMVGEGYGGDFLAEATRLHCKLPAFPAYGGSSAVMNAPLAYFATPNPVDYELSAVARYYASAFPEKAKKTALFYINYPAVIDIKDKEVSAWSKVGVHFLPSCEFGYSLAGEPDWKPFVQKAKDCGAEAVAFLGTPYPFLENFLDAANQLNFRPDYLLEPNYYDESFAKWNTSQFADRIYVQIPSAPFEAAPKNKAINDYLDIVRGNGGDVSQLGAGAASAFLLWASAVQACGSSVTRACVLDHAAKEHSWTAGGLVGTPGADVGGNKPSPCAAIVQLHGTKWVQINPTTLGEFDCNDQNVQPVTGKVVDNAKLGTDRKSHTYGG